MSYQSSRSIGRPRVHRDALGGLWDSFWGAVTGQHVTTPELETGMGRPQESVECQAKANQATAELDAKRLDLASNWNPTGYYTPDDVAELVNKTLETLQATATMMQNEISSEAVLSTDSVQQQLATVQKRIAEARPFADAASKAKLEGIKIIDSPGLRRWILSSMLQASSGVFAVTYTSCMKPWWAGIVNVIVKVFTALYNICKSIVGAVVAVGEAVLKIPDTVSTLLSIAKWGALIGGGYYLAVQANVVDDRFGLKSKKW